MGGGPEAGRRTRRTARPRPRPGQELQWLRPAAPRRGLGRHARHHRRSDASAHRSAAADQRDAAGAAGFRRVDAGVRDPALETAARGLRVLHRPRPAPRAGPWRAEAVRRGARLLRGGRVRGRRGGAGGRAVGVRTVPRRGLGAGRRDQPERCPGRAAVAAARGHHRGAGAVRALQERRLGADLGDAGLPRRDPGAAGARVPAFRRGLVRPYRRRQPAHQRAQARGDGAGGFRGRVRACDEAAGRCPAAPWRQHFRRARHRPGQEALPGLDPQRSGNRADARHPPGARSRRVDESRQAVRRAVIRDAESLAAFARGIFEAQAFSRLLGATLVRASAEDTEIRLPLRDELLQQHGFAHGGVLAYLADNAITFAGGMALGGNALTSEFKINYLRPATGEALVARAFAVSAGRRQAVCRCEIHALRAQAQALCAIAQGTVVPATAEARPEA
ncbi:hotdog fold thioesterase [Luteimonas viscosa]|uniref:Medium/long-chain acyl-CoA thioesterase YigI n=1 Tax=Luteimonas viscosa TaxID=1132694 RepID=A0A5D4XWY6_9GAMM|nr:hotdog fold thioesterase [Luteimonas viscosa]